MHAHMRVLIMNYRFIVKKNALKSYKFAMNYFCALSSFHAWLREQREWGKIIRKNARGECGVVNIARGFFYEKLN